MLITKTIPIKIIPKSLEYYRKLYNNDELQIGQTLDVNIENIPKNSKKKILVKCDVCGKEKEITIISYNRNIDNYGFYSCSQKCSYSTKNILTNREKYGKDSFTKTEDYIIKSKKTKLEKYGNENFVNIEKIKETNQNKYGVDHYMQTEKFKEQKKRKMIDKYGVEYPLQNSNIKDRWKKTNIEKYNFEYGLQSQEIKDKIRKSKIENHNDGNWNNRNKYKETCMENFGCDNPMKNEIVKKKLINTIYDRYGVYYAAQYPKFYEKMIKSGYNVKKYKDTDIYYQGTYEKDFLDKYYDKLNITRGKSIKYEFDGKECRYYPDFYLNELNLIIEIKSSRWYKYSERRNIKKKETCEKLGYNFLFIIDKDYSIFDKLIQPYS